MSIVSAVILCTLVGAVGAIILVAASKFMAVEEDPRIEEVAGCLAGANCGGCGYAGCADYAKAVVHGRRSLRQVRTRRPQGCCRHCQDHGRRGKRCGKEGCGPVPGQLRALQAQLRLQGHPDLRCCCALYGGPKTCSFACIGLGDCTKVCKFDAIHIVDGVAKVDKDKCTGCGACANICPKKVIMIDAAGPRKPVVMCSNKDKGAVANKVCTTSCIACGMCERTCKFDAIHVVDGVARVDYDKCKGCGMCAQKCPKNIILFPLKDDPYPPKPVVKPAAPAAASPPLLPLPLKSPRPRQSKNRIKPNPERRDGQVLIFFFLRFWVKSGCAGAELWFKGEKDPCGRNRGTSWNNRAHVCAMRALRPSFSAASAPSVLFDSPRLCAELAPAVILPVQAVLLRKLQTAQIAVVLFEVRGQMLDAELGFQLLPDGIDALGASLWGLMDRVVVNQSKPCSWRTVPPGASAAGSRPCTGRRAPARFPAPAQRSRTPAGRSGPPRRSPPAGAPAPRTFSAPRPGGSIPRQARCWGYSKAP